MAKLETVIEFEELRSRMFPKKKSLTASLIFSFIGNFIELIQSLTGRKVHFESHFEELPFVSAENQQILSSLVKEEIVTRFGWAGDFPDEPRTFLFSVWSAIERGRSEGEWCGGHSLDSDEAVIKAVSEAVERYSLSVFRKDGLVSGSYQELKSKGALDPHIFSGISDEERRQETFSRFRFDDLSVFGWVEARNLIRGGATLIPAQLVYLTYPKEREDIIYYTNTTGAACGRSFEEAAYRALCEAIERDAWIITYYNKLSPPVTDLDGVSNGRIKKLVRDFKRYRLNCYAIDMTTDIQIPTVLGIVRDEYSSGRIGIGAKSSLDREEAILGALLEAQKTRVWVRSHNEKNPAKEEEREEKLILSSRDLIERILFWNVEGREKNLSFLWEGPKENSKLKMQNAKLQVKNQNDYKEKFFLVLKELKEKGCDVYAKDVTVPQAKELGFCVVKILVPQLQPMHLHDSHPFLGGQRLYDVPVRLGYFNQPKTFGELNNMPPHPFT